MQIGVFGSHHIDSASAANKIAYKTGRLIAEGGHVLITGASTGISAIAAKGANDHKGIVVAISPEIEKVPMTNSIDHHDTSVLILTGMPYKMRNVISVMSCDVCIFISGGYGTLNEFTIAVDNMRPCVVIEKTGGTVDILGDLLRKIKTKTNVHFVESAESAYSEALSYISRNE